MRAVEALKPSLSGAHKSLLGPVSVCDIRAVFMFLFVNIFSAESTGVRGGAIHSTILYYDAGLRVVTAVRRSVGRQK